MFEVDSPYVVAPMRLDDVPQVMMIERQSFPLPWPERAYRYELSQNRNSHYVVLRRKAAAAPTNRQTFLNRFRRHTSQSPILGYGGFWMIAGEAHISTIAVAPPWRNKGLGELLLWNMLKQASSMGAFEATLEVRVSNLVAQNLYHKYGFKRAGRRSRYYQDNNEDAWIMTVDDFERAAYQTRLQQLGQALHQRLQQNPIEFDG